MAGAIGSVEVIRDIAIPEPRPVLQVRRAGANAVLSWTAASLGYVLENTPALVPANWTTNPSTPAIVNNQKVVTNALSAPALFYRLKK